MPKMIEVATGGRDMTDITGALAAYLAEIGARNGLLNVFIQHTSASLTVQENADPDVQADLIAHFDRLAPESAPWRHSAEGPDDMPAHVKTALTDTSLSIPVADGRLMLGTWQGVYVFEHRARGHRRCVALTFIAEGKA